MRSDAHHDPKAKAAEAMLDLLARQADLYDRLEALSKEQNALVTAEDTQPLMTVLARRQRVIDDLQAISRQVKPLRERWDSVRLGLEPSQREAADTLWGRAKESIARLLAADTEDARKLHVRKQQTGAALGQVHAKRAAVAAYAAGSTRNTNCLEKTHENV
jgi:hypothetical protein